MKIELGGSVVYLGRRRKDGYRSIERIRLPDWSQLEPTLRKAKVRCKVSGTRVAVWHDPLTQLLLPLG